MTQSVDVYIRFEPGTEGVQDAPGWKALVADLCERHGKRENFWMAGSITHINGDGAEFWWLFGDGQRVVECDLMMVVFADKAKWLDLYNQLRSGGAKCETLN